jgi:cell division protein FtsQ
MSNVYALHDGTGARDELPRRSPRSLARWLRALLILMVALCALFLAGRFLAMPLTTIRHVVVNSDVRLSEDQVLGLSGIQGTEHWYSVNTAAIRARLEGSPLVRTATVERVFPDTLRLTLQGRQPAALVLAQAGGRSLPVIVDGDGVIFRVGSSSAEVDLPVVSGLAVGQATLGEQLPRAYAPLFSDLRALREKSPALFGLLSEVRVLPRAGAAPDDGAASGIDMILYFTSSPVAVRVRGVIDESLVRYTLMVVDLLSRQGVIKDIQELDFRSGDVVYRARGG